MNGFINQLKTGSLPPYIPVLSNFLVAPDLAVAALRGLISAISGLHWLFERNTCFSEFVCRHIWNLNAKTSGENCNHKKSQYITPVFLRKLLIFLISVSEWSKSHQLEPMLHQDDLPLASTMLEAHRMVMRPGQTDAGAFWWLKMVEV